MAQQIASLYAEVGADTSGLKSGLQGARRELEETGRAAKKHGGLVTNLKQDYLSFRSAASDVVSALKMVYGAVSEGAQLELARSQFDSLAQSIGTTSDAILTDLRAATSGMMSNADMIAGASQIISLGLADNQEQVVTLANLVGRLGLDMQQVILTFANNSKARLDALGLSVEGVTRRAAELEAQGFKGDAFDQAVIEALTDRVELMGDTSETTAGQLLQIEAAAKDATDALKTELALMAGPMIQSTARTLRLRRELKEAQEKGIITAKQERDALWDLYNARTTDGDALKQAIDLMREYDKHVKETRRAVEDLGEATEWSARQWRVAVSSAIDADRIMLRNVRTWQEGREAVQQSTFSLEAYNKTLTNSIRFHEELNSRQVALFQATIETDGAVGFFNETLSQMRDRTVVVSNLTGDQKESLDELRTAYDRAVDTLRSYESGVRGVGLSDAERAKAIEEQIAYIGQLEAAMQPFLSVQSSTVNVAGRMTINQEAVNRALLDSVGAAGASREEMALLGIALGEYDAIAADAALKTALIKEGLDKMAKAALEDGVLTRGEIANIQRDAQALVDTVLEMPPVTEMKFIGDTKDAQEKVDNLKSSAAAAAGEYVMNFNIRTSGSIPTVPGPHEDPIHLQHGADFIVPAGFPRDTFGPIYVQSGEHVKVTPASKVNEEGAGPMGGNVTINMYGSRATPQQVATEVSRVLTVRG